jgi:hypothetical protein
MSELDGNIPKTIEQLLAEVQEANAKLIAARKQEEEADEAAGIAANRTKDALNVFNGAARRFEAALHKAAPAGTVWNEPEGGAA